MFQPWNEASPSVSTSLPDPPQNLGLRELMDLHEGLIGQWCAVSYDGDVYSGIIQDVDIFSGFNKMIETDLAHGLHKISLNHFFGQ